MRKSVSFLIAVLFMMIWGGSALAAVNLPQDLTIIEESAFENDTSLEGLLAFPDGTLEIRANALTGTNLFALDVPASAAALGEQQLNDAAYVRIRGEQTQITGLSGIQYMIGLSGSAAADWAQANQTAFVPESDLLEKDGFYYQRSDNGWTLLSAADPGQTPSSLRIPAVISGQPVASVTAYAFMRCTGLSRISAPEFLEDDAAAAALLCPQAELTYYPWQDYYPIVQGVDFGGTEVHIIDWWSGDGDRSENPTAGEAAQYAYQDWINEAYNVRLKQTGGADWGGIAGDMCNYAAIPANDYLRIYIIPADVIGTVLNHHAAAPLSDQYVNLNAAKWNSAQISFLTRNGDAYGCSVGSAEPRQCLYFNKRVLEEAGIDWNTIYDMQAAGAWTWSAFENMLSAIHRDTDGDGMFDVYGIVGYDSDMYRVAVFVNGGSFFDFDAGGNLRPAADSAAALEALNWARSIKQNYWAIQPEGTYWDWYKNMWAQGNCGFYVGEAWEGFSQNFSGALNDEWGCVAFPVKNAGDPYVTIVSENAVMIPACYDSATVAKLLLLYDLWTDPNNGYSFASSTSSFLRYTDQRAVTETYAMLRNAAHGRMDRTLFLGSVGDVLGGLLWGLDEASPAQLVSEEMGMWQELCAQFNGN